MGQWYTVPTMSDKRKSPRTNPKFKHSLLPTIAVDRLRDDAILEAVHAVFVRHNLASIDIEALIFLTMKQFGIEPSGFRTVYGKIRKAIIRHYAIQQGDLIPNDERPVRRVVVCFTVEEGKE